MALAEQVALNQLEMDHDTVRTTVLHVNGRNGTWCFHMWIMIIQYGVSKANLHKNCFSHEYTLVATL